MEKLWNIFSSLGGSLNAQVLAAVNKMPRWKPGKLNGRAVPVTFTLPVKFELKVSRTLFLRDFYDSL